MHNSSKGNQMEFDLSLQSENKEDLGNVSDHSDDSLQNEATNHSFEREDESEPIKDDLKPEKRPPKLSKEEEKVKEIEEKEKNQNIMDFLDSSLSIDIMKPNEIENTTLNNSSNTQEYAESDPSLIASSNSLNFKFYESSQDSPDTGYQEEDKHDTDAQVDSLWSNSKIPDSDETEMLEKLKNLNPYKEKATEAQLKSISNVKSCNECEERDDSLERDNEENKEQPTACKKAASYTPIKKGYFVRK